MEIQRERIADVLLTAAIVSIGLLSGSAVLAGVVSGIGINWASELTRQGWRSACQNLLGSSGFLNHDLQRALDRAFCQAITHLEQAWWRTPRGDQMHRTEPQAAREAEEAFKRLRTDAALFCTDKGLGRAGENEQVRNLLYSDPEGMQRSLSEQLATYLHGYDEQLVTYLQRHLTQELAFWFGEELKGDRPDNNRAWRAFQRLLLEGVQAGLNEVRANQQETGCVLAELRAWAQRMESLSSDAREGTGLVTLEHAVADTRDQLLDSMARESGLTRDAVAAGVAQIASLLRDELGDLRREMLRSLQHHGLASDAPPLPVDLRRQMDRLLHDYGLFGGRAEVLSAVEEFLADPQGGYLFLSSPSGYGKTALLAQLARRKDVVYHFINRAYGTADEDFLLRSLCQQLAARHGLGGWLPTAPAELRVLFAALLRLPPADGRPVVVLVDGLDEALSWDPGPQHFPPDVPDGVKVILSARHVADLDWPSHLRLPRDRVQCLSLEAMAADDLAALLRAAGGIGAPLADDRAWRSQALQVSAGDPFYLRLLIEDINAGRLQPSLLGSQPAGLDAYLKGWWQQLAAAVRAQDARDLLGCLAAARGPLQRDDLVAMFPGLGWALDGVLDEVRRFVVGSEHDGYALCNARFADYVRGRVGSRAMEEYVNGLVVYCSAWREHRSAYALAHYAGHLADTGRWEELHALVAVGEQCREWAEAHRSTEGSYAGYLAALQLAWAHADVTGRSDRAQVGWQVRYALIQSSVLGLATSVPPKLLAAAVKSGVLSPKAGLAYARHVPEPEQQAEALARLAPVVGECFQHELVAMACAIRDERSRAEALAWIAPHIPQLLLREQALPAVRAIGPDHYRTEALVVLAVHLPEEERTGAIQEALTTVQRVQDGVWRASMLLGLARQMPDCQRLEIQQEIIAAVRDIDSANFRVQFLESLARLFPGPESTEMLRAELSAVRATRRASERAKALATLVPYLPEAERGPVQREVLSAAQDLQSTGTRVHVLLRLAPSLPPALLSETLDVVCRIENERAKTDGLVGLAPHLSGPLLRDAFLAARALQQESFRSEALAGLAPFLPANLLAEVPALISAIGTAGIRVRALAEMISFLPEGDRTRLLEEGLATARGIPLGGARSRALVRLIPHLATPQRVRAIREALLASQTIDDGDDQARLLSEMARYLPESEGLEAYRAALAAVQTVESDLRKKDALAELVPQLPEPLVAEALAVSRTIEEEFMRVEAMARVAGRLPEPERSAALHEALLVSRGLTPDSFQSSALVDVAPHLPATERLATLQDALVAARSQREPYLRVWALIDLIPHLSGAERAAVSREALEMAKALGGEEARARALAGLVSELSEPLLSESVAAARSLEWARERARALTWIASHLPTRERCVVFGEALDAVRQIRNDHTRSEALADLVSKLPKPLLREALAVARAFADGYSRGQALESVVRRLDELGDSDRAQALVGEIGHEYWRAEASADLARHWVQLPWDGAYARWQEVLPVLADSTRENLLSDLRALAPAIDGLGGQVALAETCRAVQDVGHWWP